MDHYICTLDVKNTFHAMGMISAVTSVTKSIISVICVLRSKMIADVSMVGEFQFCSAGEMLWN